MTGFYSMTLLTSWLAIAPSYSFWIESYECFVCEIDIPQKYVSIQYVPPSPEDQMNVNYKSGIIHAVTVHYFPLIDACMLLWNIYMQQLPSNCLYKSS